MFEEKRIFKSLGVYTGSKHNDLQNVDKTFQFFMTIVMKSCFQLIKGVLWTKDFCWKEVFQNAMYNFGI